ncbi:hypothetical protein D9758_009002 [Tetrapyrgos nigripes]|uniref:Ribonuclease H1 N-terminal domain-containing protein n=1 Tax=Tetrapyrgos nigripes TaxID=182062 RepID=A0A8H5GKX0_9AGAR|nr:hypothetical protein D9758_009002 [Tetrapyrgos nigripes]
MKRPSTNSLKMWQDLEDLTDVISSMSLPDDQPTPKRATCVPRLYDSRSQAASQKVFKQKKWYNVYTGQTPGCYTTWADTSACTQGVSLARHESFLTYEDALHGWRQNCLAVHAHGQEFVDGSYYENAQEVLPRAFTPPPHAASFKHVPGKKVTSAPSPPPSPSQPRTPSRRRVAHALFGAASPACGTDNILPPVYWAISVNGENTVVTSVDAADAILDEARLRALVPFVKRVNSVTEAEEWFSRLETPTDESLQGEE